MSFTEHIEDEYIVRIWVDGSKSWYHKGWRHNENGPAYIDINGYCLWYLFDRLVYSDDVDLLNEYDNLSDEFKKSIIKYKLKR